MRRTAAAAPTQLVQSAAPLAVRLASVGEWIWIWQAQDQPGVGFLALIVERLCDVSSDLVKRAQGRAWPSHPALSSLHPLRMHSPPSMLAGSQTSMCSPMQVAPAPARAPSLPCPPPTCTASTSRTVRSNEQMSVATTSNPAAAKVFAVQNPIPSPPAPVMRTQGRDDGRSGSAAGGGGGDPASDAAGAAAVVIAQACSTRSVWHME